VPVGSDADQTIIGSQFFSNFFGSFVTTDPANRTAAGPTQVVTLYQIPNLSTQAMISDATTYVLGENPFYTAVIPTPTPTPTPTPPTPPTPDTGMSKLETIFVIIFVVIVLIVIAAVGFTCYYKYRKDNKKFEDANAIVYAHKTPSS